MHRQNSPNNGTATSSERKGAVGYLTHIRAGLPDSHTHRSETHRLTRISGSSYRVLFRRNISLIRGCVKFTSPFLDMLVTRSLWSSMCKSMLSFANRAVSRLSVRVCVCVHAVRENAWTS